MKLQVGVKVLLTNERGEYLFLRRNQTVDHGGSQLWDIPGGRIEENETLVRALSREVQEETGLALEKEPKLIAAQDIFVQSKDIHVVRLTYKGVATGEVTLSDEHDKFIWANVQMLKESNYEIDPYLMKLL